MPNTLAHLGIQAVFTRAAWRDADLKWIYLGCMLPDLPWIAQRVLKGLVPGIDPYAILLYSGVQSSLAFCLVLSGLVALLAPKSARAFFLLGISVLLHLLLDACQVKWANGVYLLAPMSWRISNFGWFWPEGVVTAILTVSGLLYAAANWRRAAQPIEGMVTWSAWRGIAIAVLLAVYLLLPLALTRGPRTEDNYFVDTLQRRTERVGRPIAFDRAHFQPGPDGGTVMTFAGESLHVENAPLGEQAVISLRGEFIAADRIRIDAFHVHRSKLRDLAAVGGLLIVGMTWVAALWPLFRR